MTSYTGHVCNGVVVLDGGAALPEGLAVRVEPLQAPSQAPDLADQLLQWGGQGVDLPSDLARRHDHYLHGQDES
jgi:hypothetical protein